MKIRNKRGITLVELIIAMALTVMILAASTAMINPLYSFYGDSLKKAKAIKVSGLIEKRLKEIVPSMDNEVFVATSVLSHSGTDYWYIYNESNIVKLRFNNTQKEFLETADYQGFNVEMSIHAKRKSLGASYDTYYRILVFTIKVKYGSDVLITRNVSIYLNLLTGSETIKVNGGATPVETTAYKSVKFKANLE
ncbi:MAG: PilW family protein [Christensenellales bacterium]|jgi:hypothetical protein